MLQLEKEVDILMAQVSAGAPVADSKLLLHDIAVGARAFGAPREQLILLRPPALSRAACNGSAVERPSFYLSRDAQVFLHSQGVYGMWVTTYPMRCMLQYKFTLFKREMTAHLDDWETDIVPVMRRRFTQQEERKVCCVDGAC